MIQKSTLTREEVEEIFDKNCVLIGFNNVLPEETARQIFGNDAIEFVQKANIHDKVTKFNGYGNGINSANYITKAGALIAATYNNINILATYKK